MSTHRKPRRPDTLAHYLFIASALCLLAALIIVAVIYPIPLVIGAVAFIWIRYEIRKTAHKVRRHVRRFF
jgi:hypothetical protein